MPTALPLPDLTGHRAIVPGGTGGVGEGVVRGLLAAGADVVVPTRTADRRAAFHAALGPAVTDRLHLVVHDYTTFAGADALVAETAARLGGVDHVVAPIGGWWAGGPLRGIDPADWTGAFVGLATTHMAMLRAALPRLDPRGSYSIVVGDSAHHPVPGSGLVSMEQAALLMLQRVAVAEGERRVFSLVLGPVRTRSTADAGLRVSADDIGAVVAAVAADPTRDGRAIPLHDADEVAAAIAG